MPDTTTIATGTRCAHGADGNACPWCEIETRPAGHVATRGARRLAASVRRALRDAQRERDTVRGYGLLAETVSANGATSPILRAVTVAAENVGAAYFADVTGQTIERVAGYVGRADGERLATFLTADGAPSSYPARLARRVAQSIARGTGTGRGSMPTFDIDRSDAETELIAIYRRAIRATGAAFTLADGNGHRRAMTESERELVLDTLRPERSERAPAYAQWLTGLGDTLPTVRDGHGTGHVAPHVPERDAGPLRRGTVWQRLRAVGADDDTIRALRAVWDIVNAPDAHGRYRASAPWQTVRDGLGLTVSAGTVQRRARRYALALRERERRAILGQPFTVPDAETTRGTVLVPMTTGHYRGRGTDNGLPVTYSAAGWQWQRVDLSDTRPDIVGAHHADCETGHCVRGCRAMALRPMPTRDTGAAMQRPLWTTPSCDHGDGCPIECPTRVARARRVARWDAIGADTDTDTVRALVATNTAERATTGTT